MATQIKYDTYNMETGLKCPGCGEVNLHHGKVEVFARHEDDTDGLHVVVNGEADRTVPATVTVDHDVSKAPGRRQSVRILFWCEHCNGAEDPDDDDSRIPDSEMFSLIICQHKGTTYIAWQDNDNRDDYF